MEKYKVGDKVWVAWAGHRNISEPCPVCFGKCQVTLILGNNESVILPCDYCAKGYMAPTGTITETRYSAGAELKIIDTVDVTQTATGETYEYHSGHYILRAEMCFNTEAEALACCESIAEELNKEQETRAEHIKANVKKTFSWNAGYHLREAKRKESEAVRHREKAMLCKSRVIREAANG